MTGLEHLEQDGVDGMRIVASHGSYAEARARTTGYAREAVRGAGYGAPSGAVVGFGLGLLGLAEPVDSGLVLSMAGASFGAMIWAPVELVGYALGDGEGVLYTGGGLRADRYGITAGKEVAEWAEILLGGRQTGRASSEQAIGRAT